MRSLHALEHGIRSPGDSSLACMLPGPKRTNAKNNNIVTYHSWHKRRRSKLDTGLATL